MCPLVFLNSGCGLSTLPSVESCYQRLCQSPKFRSGSGKMIQNAVARAECPYTCSILCLGGQRGYKGARRDLRGQQLLHGHPPLATWVPSDGCCYAGTSTSYVAGTQVPGAGTQTPGTVYSGKCTRGFFDLLWRLGID